VLTQSAFHTGYRATCVTDDIAVYGFLSTVSVLIADFITTAHTHTSAPTDPLSPVKRHRSSTASGMSAVGRRQPLPARPGPARGRRTDRTSATTESFDGLDSTANMTCEKHGYGPWRHRQRFIRSASRPAGEMTKQYTISKPCLAARSLVWLMDDRSSSYGTPLIIIV